MWINIKLLFGLCLLWVILSNPYPDNIAFKNKLVYCILKNIQGLHLVKWYYQKNVLFKDNCFEYDFLKDHFKHKRVNYNIEKKFLILKIFAFNELHIHNLLNLIFYLSFNIHM